MSEIAVTNWAGNVVYEACERYSPTSPEQLQSLVREAATRGQRVRVVGTRHSFNQLADTDGVHLSLRDLPRRIELIDGPEAEPGDVGVRVDGGATYTEVNNFLAGRGRALSNLASLPHITVAGAIATATHGSGDTHRSLASAVRALTFVTTSGELHTVRRGESGFENYPVHLGLFGPVLEVELDTVPAFDIATTVYENLEFHTAAEHFNGMVGQLYSFSLAPDWRNGGQALLFAKRAAGLDQPQTFFGASAAAVALHPSPGADPVAVTEQGSRPGPSYERLTHFRSTFSPSVGDEVQSEYLIPRRHVRDALLALPQFADVFAAHAHSMEIRSVAADELAASPMRGQDAVAVHITWHRDPAAVMSALAPLEAALEPFEARPHWGKIFVTSPTRIAQLFPGLCEVDRAARELDPEGIFRNRWIEETFSEL